MREALEATERQVGGGVRRDALSKSVEVPVCFGKGERGELPDNGVD